jgi:hypothetical protein
VGQDRGAVSRELSGAVGGNRHRASAGRWVVGAGAVGRSRPVRPRWAAGATPGTRMPGRPCANLRKVAGRAQAGVESKDKASRPAGMSGVGEPPLGRAGAQVGLGEVRRCPGGVDRAVWAPVAIRGGGPGLSGPAIRADPGRGGLGPCAAEGAWGGAG